MGILDRFKNKVVTITSYKLITESGSGFFNYDGKLYQSDIVRACIRPKAQAVGKIIFTFYSSSIKGFPLFRISFKASLFTFYSSSIKGYGECPHIHLIDQFTFYSSSIKG